MDYKVQNRVTIYTENATVNDTDFGGWWCVNNGTGKIKVNGVVLAPTEGVDYRQLLPGVKWNSPIQILIIEEGGVAVLTQLIYQKEN